MFSNVGSATAAVAQHSKPVSLVMWYYNYQKLPKHQTRVNSKEKLFGIFREHLAHFSWAQPTHSALLLIPQIHVPYKCGTILQAFQWHTMYCQEALMQQRNNLANTNFLTFCATFGVSPMLIVKCGVVFFSWRQAPGTGLGPLWMSSLKAGL